MEVKKNRLCSLCDRLDMGWRSARRIIFPPLVAGQEGQHVSPEKPFLVAAVMAAVVPAPFDNGVPWVLPQLAVQCRVRRAGEYGCEAALPRRRVASAIRSSDELHAQTEDYVILTAVECVDAAAGSAKGQAQVVRHAHRRRQQDDAVHAVRWQYLRGRQDDCAAWYAAARAASWRPWARWLAWSMWSTM